MGSRPRIALFTDASAAVGMTQRTGVGRVRHLDTRLLWIQDKVREKELTVGKVDGKVNPADVLTKYVGSDVMTEHLLRMACVMCSGRSALAPTIKKEEERQAKEEVRQVHFAKVNEVHEQLGTCPLLCTALARLPYSVRPFPGRPGSASCPWDTKPDWLLHHSGSSGHSRGGPAQLPAPGPGWLGTYPPPESRGNWTSGAAKHLTRSAAAEEECQRAGVTALPGVAASQSGSGGWQQRSPCS